MSHLLFANDTLLFFQAKEHQAKVVHSVLRHYEKGTGQLIHPSKCSMLTSVLDVGNIASEEKYRMSKKFTNWAERYMSVRAKEVLIKSVAQAVPTYVMGVFKLPMTLCDELTRMVRHFWWGDEDGHRKIHWLAWDHLLLPKCMGGMGFRDTRLFNQALLVRQAWRLIQFWDSLCARLLKAKYYPQGELVDTVFPSEASPTWRSINTAWDS
jgi:hypothetical protein